MKKPNFFIIGAAKCGTTSLYSWLREHPSAYMSPIKEPLYYCKDFKWRNVKSKNSYVKLYEDAESKHKAVGEASASYYLSNKAIPEIEKEYEKPKYIYMVRNPLSLVFSLHKELLKTGNEHIEDFEEAWRLSGKRKKELEISKWCRNPKWLDYKRAGSIGTRLEWILEKISSERLKVVFLEDLKEKTIKEYKKVLSFIGLEYYGREEFPVENSRGKNRVDSLQKVVRFFGDISRNVKEKLGVKRSKGTGVLRAIQKANRTSKKRREVNSGIKREIKSYYKKDVLKIEKFTDRSLNNWR